MISDRRASPYVFCICSISSRTIFHRSTLLLSSAADLLRALPLVGQLLLDDEDLEPRQPVDLQLEDRVGLLGVELEPLHDLLGRVRLAVGLADDLQDLVERVEDGLEAFEDVDARASAPSSSYLSRRVTTSRRKSRNCQRISCSSSRSGLQTSGILGRHEARQVHREGRLERRVLVEIRHHHLRVGVALQLQRNPHVVGRQVPDVDEVRQLARERDVGDALDERGLVHACTGTLVM